MSKLIRSDKVKWKCSILAVCFKTVNAKQVFCKIMLPQVKSVQIIGHSCDKISRYIRQHICVRIKTVSIIVKDCCNLCISLKVFDGLWIVESFFFPEILTFIRCLFA